MNRERTRGVAIYYHSLESLGGIERVIIEHSRIFSQRSRCVILTDEPVNKLKHLLKCENIVFMSRRDNRDQLAEIINNYEIDWLILHDPGSQRLQQYVEMAHRMNCRVALTIHFSFHSPIIFNEANGLYRVVTKAAEVVDAIACVSRYDTIFWRALGLKTFHVQNPFVHPPEGRIKDEILGGRILWVGRGAPQKKPEEALSILRLLAQANKSVHMTMVGVGDSLNGLRKAARTLGIEKHLTLVDRADDMEAYYMNNDIVLITSIVESFCLVIAEARSYGLPIAMYEMEYLDLIGEGGGILSAPFGNREKLAAKVEEVLFDRQKLKELGETSKLGMHGFNDDMVWSSWECLFEDKEAEKLSEKFNADVLIRETIKAWEEHYRQNHWKIEFCDKLERIFNGNFRRFVNIGGRFVYRPLINIKRKFR